MKLGKRRWSTGSSVVGESSESVGAGRLVVKDGGSEVVGLPMQEGENIGVIIRLLRQG